MRLVIRLLIVFLATFAFAPLISAQTVLNPTKVIVDASPDHAATFVPIAGQPAVPVIDSYQLDVMTMSGTGVLAFSKPLGKPALINGKFEVVIPEFATLAEGVSHTATVKASGPGGSAVSPASPPFGRPRSTPAPAAPRGVVVSP